MAFQEDSLGRREGVDVRYALDAATRQYGFVVAAYDAARPLVIDPLRNGPISRSRLRDVKAITIPSGEP
ncbi:MAG: hypothetical protein IPO58_19760 [Betaproteobacteria bacterium]|nr:hypothetical protein [Betaproteobacteria bacterium]